MADFVLAAATGLPAAISSLPRRELAKIVEAIIALFDATDGDPDFEPDADDEPDLGWVTHPSGMITCGGGDDREVCCEDEGGQCDDEGDVEMDCNISACFVFGQTDWLSIQNDEAYA